MATVVATLSISLIGGLNLSMHPELAIAGGVLLVIAFGLSITSYTVSPLTLGPNSQYLTDILFDATNLDLAVGTTTDADSWELSLILVMG